MNRNRVGKQADGKYSLTPNEKQTVESVVADCRRETADDGPISREMRLIADEQAQEILQEEYGIVVSLARIRRVA
jgi:hypothetical protein